MFVANEIFPAFAREELRTLTCICTRRVDATRLAPIPSPPTTRILRIRIPPLLSWPSRLHFVLQNTWGNSPRAVCKTLGYQCGCVISARLKASKGSKIHLLRKSGKQRIRTWRSNRYITFSAINTTTAKEHENCFKLREYIVQSNTLLLVHNTLSLLSWTTQCYRKLYNIDSWTILNA